MHNTMHNTTHLCSGRVCTVSRIEEETKSTMMYIWSVIGMRQETKVMIPYLREAIDDYCASCVYTYTR